MATSRVKKEKSEQNKCRSEAEEKAKFFETLQLLSNNLFLIDKLREGYHQKVTPYDIDIKEMKGFFKRIQGLMNPLKDLGYVEKESISLII